MSSIPSRILPHLLARAVPLWLLIYAVFAGPLMAQTTQAGSSQAAQKNILLLYSYGHGGKGIQVFDDGLLSTFNAAGISANSLFYEFLDLERLEQDEFHRTRVRDQLLAKHATHKFDLIITVQQPALNFLLHEGKQIAPGAPVITVQAPAPTPAETQSRRFVSQLAQFDIKGTLERALELFPHSRRVVLVSGSSDADQKMAADAVRIATALHVKLDIETTSELALDEMLQRVAHLPPHTLIIFLQYNRDARGHVTLAYEVEGMVIKAANAPVFGLYDFNLGNGGIGGSVIDVKALGEKTAQTALDLLSGKLRLTQPVTLVDNPAVPIFDWAQIERWGSDPSRLPDNSRFVNRVPTFWEDHRGIVIGVAIVFLLQSLTITVMLANQRRRKLAEQSLSESELQFRTLADSGQALIWTSGTDKLRTYFNSVWLDFTGRTLEQELGNGWAEGVHPDDIQRCLDVHLRSFNRREKFSMDYRLRHHDGEYRWIQDDGCPRYDSKSEFIGYIGYCLDITERKQIEEQLREYQTDLEDLVQQRTAELSKALETAKLADRTKDEFLANISHELRTPLNAVIGLSALARDLTSDSKQRDYLDKIAISGKHLARIINDLLDLSKIAAGRMGFEATAFSLRQLIRRGNSVMAHKAAKKGLTLAERVDAAVPDVLVGDPMRLEQILLNLIGNAIKFTPSGGVEVRIGLHAREDNRVCLDVEVADTGIGMRQEDIEHLFKPFSQADPSITRKYGGTGLGLVISQRLAKMMDGDITVESREGIGTTFRVRVWLELGEAGDLLESRPSADKEASPLCYRNARVLVVEDQPVNREIVGELLSTVGITVRMANNGQEALDILSETGSAGFDLILMDIQMPVMDGLTATRAIRAQAGFSGLPIIAMSAHTMQHEIELSSVAGMNDHIGKPFDSAGFYRILAQWIPRSKHQQPSPASPARVRVLRSIDS